MAREINFDSKEEVKAEKDAPVEVENEKVYPVKYEFTD